MNRSQQIEVPGYRIEHILGKGGMATVYRATQMSLGRPVALKVLYDPETPQFFERFLNEGRCIARLNHNNLIAIYDIGQADGFYYIAMEYLSGGDLKSRIAQGIKPAQALEILSQLAGCLAYVHNAGVIHRDIKPSNTLFRTDGTPVLTDFGIAKLIQTDNDLTVTGTVMGSPHYLSPELAQGNRQVDGRSDLYSLGIILYEMLTGKKPYTADSFAATLLAHIQKPLPRLPPPHAALQPLLNRLLAKKPEQRFQNGAELVKHLQPFLEADSGRAPEGSSQAVQRRPAAAWRQHPQRLGYSLAALLLLGWFSFDLISQDAAEQRPSGDRAAVEGVTETARADTPIVEPSRPDFLPKPVGESLIEPPEEATGSVSPTPAPQPAAAADPLAELLNKAERRLATDRLSYPLNDSARHYYHAVLEQDPDNAAALQGLGKVADRYAELAADQMARGTTLKARRYITQGLGIRPRHVGLTRLMNQLDQSAIDAPEGNLFDSLIPDNDR